MDISSFKALEKAVVQNGGVMTIPMVDLRDLVGKGKLGKYVTQEISRQLAAQGLHHFPKELPINQHDLARVYKLGTPVADLIRLVTEIDEENDEKLVARTSTDAAKILAEIRKLVN